jgi:hypothetical protein
MTQIENIISKGQLIPLHFRQADVAASQTDAQLTVAAVDNAADDALNVDEYVMPWPGEIVGISYSLSAAATAGTLTLGATVDGTEDADTTQSITTAQRGSAKIERGDAAFAAGARIGAEITTDGSWDGTGADLQVTVWVLVYLGGI